MSKWTVVDQVTDAKGFQLQTTLFEGYRIEQLKSPRAGERGEFVPARVWEDKEELWSFARDCKGLDGMAFLREHDGELVIMISNRRTLIDAIPVRDLAHRQRIAGQIIGGRKLGELIALKEALAKAEGLEPIWSARESAFREALGRATAEARRQQKLIDDAAAEAERLARRAERDARRAAITGRMRVFANTHAGDRRHGYPVLGNEWECLTDGTFCISVTSFNEETGELGELVESFVVKTEGSRKVRKSVTPVTSASALATAVAAPKVEASFVIVPVKGTLEEVILVRNVEAVRALRDQGVNSGSLAMYPKKDVDGKFSLVRLTEGKIETVGEVMYKQ